MTLPAIASEIGAHYLARFDARHPGLLTGLYVVGSIALDDFRDGHSDVDFIAVTGRPMTAAEVAPIHTQLAARWQLPHFDGIYLRAGELATPATDAASGIAIIDGRVIANSNAERHDVTWLTLLLYGVALRGPAPSADWISVDVAAARDHARHNLAQYWRPWLAARRSLLLPTALHSLTADAAT